MQPEIAEKRKWCIGCSIQQKTILQFIKSFTLTWYVKDFENLIIVKFYLKIIKFRCFLICIFL